MSKEITCPHCGYQFKNPHHSKNAPGANPQILAFFTEETVTKLIGSPSLLKIEFDPEINGNDNIKFIDNSKLDELNVLTLGTGKYTEIIALLSGAPLH